MGIAGTSEAGVLAVELSPRTKTRQYAVLTMSEWNKRSEERDNPHKEDAFYSWAQCLSVIPAGSSMFVETKSIHNERRMNRWNSRP